MFKCDERGEHVWRNEVETDRGDLCLLDGASRLTIDGVEVAMVQVPEYARLYDPFAAPIAARSGDADLSPWKRVADAALLGERETSEPFSWDD